MRHLSKVLAAKIVITILAWALPLLFFPRGLLVNLGFPAPEPEIFLRLLGIAYMALVVGYALGFRKTLRNEYPLVAVWVGIVSNGGATIVLVIGAVTRIWSHWGPLAQLYMWLSLASSATIALGLMLFGSCRMSN